MADMEWRGDAIAIPEITDAKLAAYVPGGRYGLKLYNQPLIEVVAPPLGSDLETSDSALQYVGDALIEQLGNRSINAYYSPDASNTIRIESNPGYSTGTRVQGSAACYVEEVRKGVASTAQKFRIVLPAGASGGTWKMTFGWSTNVYDTSTIAYNASESTVQGEIVTAANEVASLSASGVTVNLIAAGSSTESRVYEVTMGGGFAGYNFNITPNGDALAGVGSVTCLTVQEAAGSATAIHAIAIPLLANTNNSRQQWLKFSRDGVTSAEVYCESATTQPSAFQADVDAALATVLGANAVVTKIAAYSEGLSTQGGMIVIVVKWLKRGAQTPLSCVYWNKAKNSPPPNATSPGNAFTTVIRSDGDNQSEFLLAKVVPTSNSFGAAPASYEVTQGATTWTITHTSSTSRATLITQWEAGVGSGNAEVRTLTGVPYHNIYVMEFKGAKANSNEDVVTFTTPNTRTFQVISDGEPLLNEIQQVVINGKGGTFTASSDGTTYTSGLAYNLNAAAFQTALRGLSAIGSGNCNVTGSGTAADPFLVEYVSGKAVTDMPTLKFNIGSLLGGANPVIQLIAAAVVGVSQQSRVYLDPNLNGGYLIPIVDGVFDSRVAYNGNAAAWESAIESIPGAGCSVAGSGYPFIVTFDALGPKKLTLNQDQATVSTSSLITLTLVQVATGPNHWNQPLNWSGGVVPGSGDVAILRDGASTIMEGLNQRATFTVDTTTGNLVMGTDITNVGHFVPGQKVYLSTSGTFPTATSGGSITISASTGYYVTAVDYKTRRLQLSLTQGGSPIEFTNAGSGTHTVEVVLGELQHHMTFTGTIGLPRRYQGGLEERPRWLLCGADKVNIGLGDTGNGSQLINLDLGSRVTSFKQYRSSTGQQNGEYATNIRNGNTGSPIWAGGGRLAISPTDMNSASSTVGAVTVNRCDLLLGKVSVGSLEGSGSRLESPYGYTNRGTTIWLN